MSHSQRLRLRDVRAVFRLVGEAREMGEHPSAWRRHVVENLLRLIGAKRGLSVDAPTIGPDGSPIPACVVDRGWCDEFERQMLLKYNADPGRLGAPEWPSYIELLKQHPFFTRRRRQVLSDREWYGSLHVQEIRRPCDLDDFLYSSARLRPDCDGVHVLCLHRARADKPFEPLQHRLVHLLHDELRRSWQPDPAMSYPDPCADLAPRLQQTLARLLAGDSEKEVARHLGLSRHTVHHYVVGLYRHFQVSSRGELLSQYFRLARTTIPRPPLLFCSSRDPFRRADRTSDATGTQS
jgi:DNA-binding CsgD family transcriptional regulator